MTEQKKAPHLIQRLQKTYDGKPREGAKGVDRFFMMDYMGSSEFEWGALPASLKRIRAMPKIAEPKRIKVNQYVVWYVGPAEYHEVAELLFRDQLNSRQNQKMRLKEATRIFDTFIGDDWLNKKRDDYVGWWDVENDWAFFITKDHARNWIKTLWPAEESKPKAT
jgi:hypothetical protein